MKKRAAKTDERRLGSGRKQRTGVAAPHRARLADTDDSAVVRRDA